MRGSRVRSVAAITLALVLAGCVVIPPPSPRTGTTTTLPATIHPSDAPVPTRTLAPTPAASATRRPGGSPRATPGVEPVAWSACQGGLQCATLEVPIDYENPDGAVIGLALIRHRADNQQQRIGSLLMNPGGPGGSGVSWVRSAWSSFGSELTDRFDIVGFDPRGIGESEAIRCLDTRPLLTDAFPETAAEEQEFIDAAMAVVEACQDNHGALLPFVGTDNVARDLDRIRAALGDEQLTYYGFSYGTFIGATYADLFPANVRAMVLDGPVDPALDFAAFVNTQSAASQSELDEFLKGCAGRASCSFSPNEDPERAFDALMERFDQGPIDGVTASVALAAVYGALVADRDDVLETILTLAAEGSTSPMADAGSWATDARALDGYDAVNCLDYPMPRTADAFAQVAEGAAQVAPDIGAWNTYTYFDCAFWPTEPTRVPGPLAAAGAPPILVVAATGDPSTPYEWGVSLADQLESGVLITREGDGHTSFHFSACVRNIATTYLLTLTAPTAATTCS